MKQIQLAALPTILVSLYSSIQF